MTAYYIPVVLGAAGVTYLASGNVTAAVATMLVACSRAIAMATPIAVLGAVGQAARRGIVVKGGRYLEVPARWTRSSWTRRARSPSGGPR